MALLTRLVSLILLSLQAQLSLATSNRALSVGIEFGLDGVSSSAGLANGTAIALASIEGDASYKRMMHGWYKMAAEAAATQLAPTNMRSTSESLPAACTQLIRDQGTLEQI